MMERKQNYADWRPACGSEDDQEEEEREKKEFAGAENSQRGAPSGELGESFGSLRVETTATTGREKTCQKGWP